MSQIAFDESRLKEIFKTTLIEVLEERRDVFYEAVAEALEDIGLANAIREGEKTKSASRAEVFKILEGRE